MPDRNKFDQADEQYQKVMKSASARIDAYLQVADYYADRGYAEHFQQAVEAAAKAAPFDRRQSYYRGIARVLEKKDPAAAEKRSSQLRGDCPRPFRSPHACVCLRVVGKALRERRQAGPGGRRPVSDRPDSRPKEQVRVRGFEKAAEKTGMILQQ
jgi:hypothetical protein